MEEPIMGKRYEQIDLFGQSTACNFRPSNPCSAMLRRKLSRKMTEIGFPSFVERHVGPSDEELREMLQQIGYDSLESLIDATVPESIRFDDVLELPESETEFEVLREFRKITLKNQVAKSYIGLGYHACVTPPVIQRNILE